MAQIHKLQQRVWQNKLAKGFNTTNVNQEFNLLYGEVSEAFDAWRKKTGGVPAELADIVIYTMALATMLDIDLEEAVQAKVVLNEKREYVTDYNGVLIKKKEII